jgi:DNA-binding response OmpR family regulator
MNLSALSSLALERPPHLGSRGRALVIEADPTGLETCSWALRALDFESAWARRGLEGVAAARHARFDLVMVSSELPDMAGVDVVKTLRAEYDGLPCIVLARTESPQLVRGPDGRPLAMLTKPFNSTDVIAVVNSTMGVNRGRAGAYGRVDVEPTFDPDAANGLVQPPRVSRTTAGSVAQRWAHFVLRTIDAENDPKTVTAWAKIVGVSRSVLSECCRLVHVSAHEARDFSRLLRAVCRSGEQWQPEAILDLADGRTLKKLLARAGLTWHTRRTPTMREFLQQQRWIDEGNPGLVALHSLLFDATNHPGE